jgi:hypothetical protein
MAAKKAKATPKPKVVKAPKPPKPKAVPKAKAARVVHPPHSSTRAMVRRTMNLRVPHLRPVSSTQSAEARGIAPAAVADHALGEHL